MTKTTLAFALAAACSGLAHGAVQSYALADRGALQLDPPASWRGALALPAKSVPPTIRFDPPSGQDFKFVVAVLWSPKKDKDYTKPEAVKALVDKNGRGMLAKAVEKDLSIVEVKRGGRFGYYYTLTDAAVPRQELPFLTQGVVALDDLRLSFTFLSRGKPGADLKAALDVLLGARLAKGG